MHSVIISITVPEIRDSLVPDERMRAVELERSLADIEKLGAGMLCIARGVYALHLHNNLPLLLEMVALAEKAEFGYQVFSCDSPIVRQAPMSIQNDATASSS